MKAEIVSSQPCSNFVKVRMGGLVGERERKGRKTQVLQIARRKEEEV